MTVNVYCTEFKSPIDGHLYCGPHIIASSWEEAEVEARLRLLTVTGPVVCEVDAEEGTVTWENGLLARELLMLGRPA